MPEPRTAAQRAADAERRAHRRPDRATIRRRRAVALGLVGVVLVGGVVLVAGGGGDDPPSAVEAASTAAKVEAAKADAPPLKQLPGGGRTIFPRRRVVAFYGNPQDDELGILGIGKGTDMLAKLKRQAAPYARKTRPVLPALELIATVAAADPGDDGAYVVRASDKVIGRYLRLARRAKALLVLDVQPGRADFPAEVARLEKWMREPDVGLALDPEWRVGADQIPGQVIGTVSASEVNAVSAWLSGIVKAGRLPEKLFVVHQFTEEMVTGSAQLAQRPGLATVFNVDGFGARPNKVAKYRALTAGKAGFRHGFKLFYKEDLGLMKPSSVMALQPRPDLVVYE